MSAAEDHRLIAGTFADRVRGVTDWEAPAPVEGWTARDVVAHLVEWFPGFVAVGTEHRWKPGAPVSEDPVSAWQAQTDGVQALLDDPEIAASTFSHPYVGEMPLAQAIENFYIADIFMHTWDLARATGQDDRLDPDRCAAMVAGMQQMEEVIRSSGQYGAAHPVPDDADPQTRLLGFIGRDPEWRPSR